MVTRYIKLSEKTAGHKALLESKGYEVGAPVTLVETRGKSKGKEFQFLPITATSVREDPIDLRTDEGKDTIRELVANQGVLSYATRVTLPNGKEIFGTALASKFGPLSCIITREAPSTKTKKGVSNEMSSLLTDLGF